MRTEALILAKEIGFTEEHPDYPVIDWQEAVANSETRDGYWDWVWIAMRHDNHAWLETQN